MSFTGHHFAHFSMSFTGRYFAHFLTAPCLLPVISLISHSSMSFTGHFSHIDWSILGGFIELYHTGKFLDFSGWRMWGGGGKDDQIWGLYRSR
jgi:hypothetical protein